MTVRRGNVVTVDLGGPTDDDTRGGEVYKTRPAVVIQNDVGNKHSITTIVAPISSGHTNYPFHANLPATVDGLTKDSHVQLDQIRTVDMNARIDATHGTVTASQMNDIEDAIRVSLGL